MLSNHDSTTAKSPPRTARRHRGVWSSVVECTTRRRPPRVVHNLCTARCHGRSPAFSAALTPGREGSGTTYTVAHA